MVRKPDYCRYFFFSPASYIKVDIPFYPMRSFIAVSVFVLLCLSGTVLAQATAPAVLVPEVLSSSDDMSMMDTLFDSVLPADGLIPPQLQPPSAVLPLMSSELALQT